MPVTMTPQEFIEKWGRRMQAAAPDIQSGINRVTEAPGVKAAKQQNAMLNGVNEAVSSGKWARNVAAVSVDQWKQAALTKGVQRIAAGVTQAQPRMGDAVTKLLSDVNATLAEVERTPRGDLATNINRAVTMMQGMAARAKQR